MMTSSPLQQETQKTMSKRSKKKVTFYQYACVLKNSVDIVYTAEEKESCWHTTEDMIRMKSQLQKDVDVMEKTFHDIFTMFGGIHDADAAHDILDNDAQFLGLERFTHVRKQLRRRIRQETTYAVLDEQDLQLDSGVYDDERIAQQYREATSTNLRLLMNSKYSDMCRMMMMEETPAAPPLVHVLPNNISNVSSSTTTTTGRTTKQAGTVRVAALMA